MAPRVPKPMLGPTSREAPDRNESARDRLGDPGGRSARRDRCPHSQSRPDPLPPCRASPWASWRSSSRLRSGSAWSSARTRFATTHQAPAVTTSQVKHHSATPPGALAAKADPIIRYRQVVANMAAAMVRHDFAAQYLLGRAARCGADPGGHRRGLQGARQLVASLEAAAERHDTHSRGLIMPTARRPLRARPRQVRGSTSATNPPASRGDRSSAGRASARPAVLCPR